MCRKKQEYVYRMRSSAKHCVDAFLNDEVSGTIADCKTLNDPCEFLFKIDKDKILGFVKNLSNVLKSSMFVGMTDEQIRDHLINDLINPKDTYLRYNRLLSCFSKVDGSKRKYMWKNYSDEGFQLTYLKDDLINESNKISNGSKEKFYGDVEYLGKLNVDRTDFYIQMLDIILNRNFKNISQKYSNIQFMMSNEIMFSLLVNEELRARGIDENELIKDIIFVKDTKWINDKEWRLYCIHPNFDINNPSNTPQYGFGIKCKPIKIHIRSKMDKDTKYKLIRYALDNNIEVYLECKILRYCYRKIKKIKI